MSSTTPFARIVACDELGPCTVQQPCDQALARPKPLASSGLCTKVESGDRRRSPFPGVER